MGQHQTFEMPGGYTLWVERTKQGYQAGILYEGQWQGAERLRHSGGFCRPTKFGAIRAALRFMREHGDDALIP
jgi:hypothetical protein